MTPELVFETLFPTEFAESVKELIDDAPLDALLARLALRLSEHLDPFAVTIQPHEEQASATDASGRGTAVGAVRDIADARGTSWGRLLVSGPPGVGEPDARHVDATAAFASWLVDRHRARRRRLESIDRERQLIAGQLHDDSIQAMTAISLTLQRLARTAPVPRDDVEYLLHLTNDAIDRLRHMMFSLHPPTLATDGLVPTLEDYLDAFIAPSGLRVSVHGDPTRRATPATEALAFRLARGAVNNSWKHAGAGSIDLTVTIDDREVRVVVRDDGVGFDPAPHPHSAVGHAGIEYARDLATEVGGRYDIESTLGVGTAVTIVLPVL